MFKGVFERTCNNGSNPFQVITQVDSFFLNGTAPALLSALRLTQDSTVQEDSFYNFYAPNYGANILGIADVFTSWSTKLASTAHKESSK